MAVKHVLDYINQVEDQYLEMLDLYKETEKEVQDKIVDTARLDSIKAMLQPLVQNYTRLEYVAYLLSIPSKKEKQRKWEKQNAKLLEKLGKDATKKAVVEENKCSLEKARKELSNI